MILLDGKETAARIRGQLKAGVEVLQAQYGRVPSLTVILVGEDPGSMIYVRNKERACADTGMDSETLRLPADLSQAALEAKIRELNENQDVDGILLQLPLPKGLDSQACLELLSPEKDVDGFTPVNMGKLALGLPGLKSCTPAGVMRLLQEYGLSPFGKKAVVLGRSNIVGRPLSLLLGQYGEYANATVTVCHSRTPDLAGECRRADFLFVAIGKPKFVTRDMVKPGAVVVDVGMNRTDNGLCGDCDFEALKDVVSAMTPVPGGVGPMTIAQLLVNTVQAFKARMEK
ncbi:MAG: bifunctional methylenetetrahydrofolate dehydrogenase/methenyltetrahydrofolate cyclohydrolase FolD [Thermodesulfobacteriota bacterium]|nr:bifunctional methylenetetrahydrofolate dehydrogenase/methenyltetrahydrofolate cyclohydrolase FolD [Thermodesulfobacteriota bacterium]